MRNALIALLITTLSGLAVAAETPAVSPAPPADPTIARAMAAVGSLKMNLKGALTAALEKGPAGAVAACNGLAPKLTAEAAVPGVLVGRATLKPRNLANGATGWRRTAIEQLQANPKPDALFTERTPDGTLHYAEPIRMAPLCLACHGTAVTPDLQGRLKALYPDDQATGYAESDFRGIFWAEVAPPAAPAR